MEKNFDGVYKAGIRNALQKASQAITTFVANGSEGVRELLHSQ